MSKTRKPSSRTHRMKPIEGLNLTPFIDMITCLMFFLLMFAAVIPIAIIDSPLPKVASTSEEQKQAKDDDKKKMDVTVFIENKGMRVKSDVGGEKFFPKGDKYPMVELHKYLVTLHTKKPDSHEITLVPSDDITYESIIEAMDASRELQKDDEGYRPVPPEIAQKPEREQFNRLFPDVSIGGV